MNLTFARKIDTIVPVLNKETGEREKMNYLEWCRENVNNINNGKVEKFRKAVLVYGLDKKSETICHVEAW